MSLPRLNKFQEDSLLEMAKGKSHVQVAKELGRNTTILRYHKEKFFSLGLLELVNGKPKRTSIAYEIVPTGKLIGGHWRKQFDNNWLKNNASKTNGK